jgi:AP2 domain/HNH endonuclease
MDKAISNMKLITEGIRQVVFEIDDNMFEFIKRFKWISSIIGENIYITTNIRGKTIYLHRMLMIAQQGETIDHIDRNTLNNKLHNLRISTLSQNAANRESKAKNKSSKYRGVIRDKERNKWMTTINKDGKHFHLGRFNDEIDAAKAYDKKAVEFWGEFAYLNFPGDKDV